MFTNPSSAAVASPISAVVPMLPVRDVERAAAFYKLLGFEVGNREPKVGKMGWAWLYAPTIDDWRRGPNLMLWNPNEAESKPASTVYYFYVDDLPAFRESLVRASLKPTPIAYPEYLPNGEMELIDPDGHELRFGQRADDTP
jgi:catechol 2,3-dioxygenase-like lactoylglutathione lyase family enzyme